MSHRRSAKETAGDPGLTDASAVWLPDLGCFGCSGCWPAQSLAILTRMLQTSSSTFSHDLAFEGSEYRQQTSHGPARWCGQIQTLGQRHETRAEMIQLFQG